MTVVAGRRILGRGTHVTAGVLVAVAGLLEVVAQLRRWSPCFAGFTTTPCGARQDHRYDAFLPTPPWTPTGPGYEQFTPAADWVPLPDPATPTGVAFLLLAAALALTVRVGGPGRTGGAAVALASWCGFAVLVAVVGAVNVASGLAGEALTTTSPVAAAWSLLGPLLGVGLALRVVAHRPVDLTSGAVAAVLVIVGLRDSVAEYIGASVLVSSHDTPPFQGGPAAVALVALGAVLVAAGLRTSRP